MTRGKASTELLRLIPNNEVLRAQILNLMEANAETAFIAGLQRQFETYEEYTSKKRKDK